MASLKVIGRLISSRSFSSVIQRNTTVAVNSVKNTRRTLISLPRVAALAANGLLPTTSSFSRVCGCGMHSISEGDQQLLTFLKAEIDYETETLKNVEKPKQEIFNQPDNLKEIKFKVTKLLNGERIVVSFDVDQSINSHDDDVQEDDDVDDDDNVEVGQITSYPSFSVQIIKDSGETLHFNCEYEIDGSTDEDDDEELFTITDVSLLPHPDAEHHNIYHYETENIDYNFYELLLGMLAERGINNEFVEDLLKKSTVLEHKHYIQFLEGLQGFLSQK